MMNTDQKTARLAGAIYLVVVLTGTFSLAYVPSKLIFWDDPSKTLHRLTESVQLLRWDIVSSMLCYLAFLALPLALYQLLRQVNENCAKLMVILATVSVPIALLNLQHKFDVLTLIDAPAYLKGLNTQQVQQQVLFSLDSYGNGIKIVQLFWGLWLLPFGYLVYRSNRLPKVLGIFLMLGCLGYLINVLASTALPHYSSYGIASYIRMPASIGEIGACLWLLVMGIKNKNIDKQH